MSDTIACSNCGTEVPSAASFCTGCGQALATAATPPPPPADDTRIETPGLNDATQVHAPPPPPAPPSPFAPPAPLPPAAPASGPWGPSTSATAPPPTAPPAPPAAAPWSAPTPPGPPTQPEWQPPTAPPPGAATFAAPGAPPAAGMAWGAPGVPAAPGAPWGTEVAAAPTSASKSSVLGGIVALIGSVLTLVGVFSGWVKLGETGTVSAWSLTAGDGLIKTQTPYAIVALAVVGIIVALLLFVGVARTPVRIVAALVGLAIIGVTAANWAEIASFVTDNFPSTFKATTAIGFYLAIIGGVLVLVSALLPAKKK